MGFVPPKKISLGDPGQAEKVETKC